MLEQLLAVNAMILRAASNTNLSTKMLAQRLNLLNGKRMRIVEHGNNSAPAKAADKTRIELIHYFGQLAEAKIRSRI